MKCPFCELDKPYVQAGAECPHCHKLIPVPAEIKEPEPETAAELEAANDTVVDPHEDLLPPDEFEPETDEDADPDESG